MGGKERTGICATCREPVHYRAERFRSSDGYWVHTSNGHQRADRVSTDWMGAPVWRSHAARPLRTLDGRRPTL